MTIRYLDPEGGNDANDGTTFANRKKTMGSISAGLVAGDELRIMASRDPWSIGNAQWTDGVGSIVLDTPVTMDIDPGEDAWFAGGAGGVTAVFTATAANRKQGNAAISAAHAASGAWAGVMIYKPFVEQGLQGFAALAESHSAAWTVAGDTLSATSINTASGQVLSGAYPLLTKRYWEVTLVSGTIGIQCGVGLGPLKPFEGVAAITPGSGITQSAAYLFSSTPGIYANKVATRQITMPAPAVGAVFGIAYDPATRKAWFRLNGGLWNNDAAQDPATGAGGIVINGNSTLYPMVSSYSSAMTYSINYGESAFGTAAPSGYNAAAPAALPGLDLSGFEAVSFWMMNASGAAIAAGVELYVDLCSDVLGQTPILSLPVGWQNVNGTSTSGYMAMLCDNGTALPSGVKSIALRSTGKLNGTPGTAWSLYFDNFIACHTQGANHVSHCSLVGKKTTGEPEWHPVQYITGSTIGFGNVLDKSVQACVYHGVTEDVTTYVNNGTLLPLWNNATTGSQIAAKVGTWANQINVTGGWDRTAMTSQVGQTWLNAKGMYSSVLNFVSGGGYFSFMDGRIGLVGAYSQGIVFVNTMSGGKFKLAGIYNCGTPLGLTNNQTKRQYLDLGNVGWCGASVKPIAMAGSNSVIRARRIFNSSAEGLNAASLGYRAGGNVIQVGKIDGCVTFGVTNTGTNSFLELEGTTFQNNGSGSASCTAAGTGIIHLKNCNSTDATLMPAASTFGTGDEIRITGLNGDAANNQFVSFAMSAVTDTGVVHGVAPRSVKLMLNSWEYSDPDVPAHYPLARIACFAGQAVTYKVWTRKDVATNIHNGIMVSGSVAGIVETRADGAATDQSWEQLSLTFTPTVNGVVDIYAFAYAVGLTAQPGTPPTAWFSDPSVSQ